VRESAAGERYLPSAIAGCGAPASGQTGASWVAQNTRTRIASKARIRRDIALVADGQHLREPH